MNDRVIGSIIAVALLWFGQSQAATLTQWGTSASAYSADCTLIGCNKLFLPFITEAGPSNGGLNQTSAQLLDYADPNGRGTVSALVELQGGLSIPIFKAKATSVDADGWVSATAIGIQGYQFTGSDNTTISLDSGLTGGVNNPSDSDVTGLSVGIWLMTPTETAGISDVDTMSELFLQVVTTPVANSLTYENLSTDYDINATLDTLELTLDYGDEFYMLAALTAAADGTDAWADAFSTLEMEFNTDELVPASVVPVPAAAWLFGSGLLGLIGMSRRKKAA